MVAEWTMWVFRSLSAQLPGEHVDVIRFFIGAIVAKTLGTERTIHTLKTVLTATAEFIYDFA